MQERVYDLIFIARPATPEDEVKKVIGSIEQACTEKGAKIEKTEHWGTRKLAYKVMKHREGVYVYHQIRTTHAELMQEIERRLGVLDSIIKYQTVRLDEALKLQKKLTHKREIRAARRPRRAVAPQTPSAPPPSAPVHTPPASTPTPAQAAPVPERTAPAT
jgi:small subunit ribosomal protein S6